MPCRPDGEINDVYDSLYGSSKVVFFLLFFSQGAPGEDGTPGLDGVEVSSHVNVP